MKYKVNIYILFFTVILLCSNNFFYLIPSSLISLNDVNVILEFAFFVYVCLKCRVWKKNRYIWYILFTSVLVITSSIAAYRSYHQPLLSGIMPQRSWLMATMLYFPLSQLIKNKLITTTQLINTFEKYVAIYILIIIIQFLVSDIFIFINVSVSERYGSARLYVSVYYLTLIYFLKLKKLIYKVHLTFFDLYLLIGSLFIVIFVTKTRMHTIAIIAATILYYFSVKMTKYKFLFVLFLISGIVIFLNSSYGESFLNNIYISNQDAGTQIRDVGREFYLSKTGNSMFSAIFGCGYVNTSWLPAYIGSKMNEKITYVDHGLIGLYFYYGIIFVIWTACIHIRLITDAWKSQRKDLAFFLICGLISVYTLMPYNYAGLTFSLVCVLIESSVSLQKYNKKIDT